ncbi:MAG: acyloxyacyl hydrolase [Bacteroidetes bacterium]|nr:acyloxyacyl hydrolase [Bacteroidota bacterium]
MMKIFKLQILSLICFIFMFLPPKLPAQTEFKKNKTESKLKNFSVSAIYQNGYVFPTNDFVRGINAENDKIRYFQTFSFQFTKQTLGKELWEQLFNYPQYGLGVYLANFHNPEEIGLPIAAFGYFTAPFHRWKYVSLNYEFGLGVAFNWKKYSPANTYNIAIGAKKTAYIDLGIKSEIKISDQLTADLGFSLSHFSNGKLKVPNFGFNTIAPKIGVKYSFNSKSEEFIKQEIPEFKKCNELFFSFFGGAKNLLYENLPVNIQEKYEGVYFPVFGIATTFNRLMNYKSKIGFGGDINYDGSVNSQVAVDNGEYIVSNTSLADKFQISAFLSYTLVVNKVSVIIQPSFYVYRKKFKNPSPEFYQRIGINYNIYKNLYVGLNLRAFKLSISDFIEWNIGYRLNWRKSN